MSAPVRSAYDDLPRGARRGFVRPGSPDPDALTLHYLEWGPSSAATIVTLHGGGQTAYAFTDLAANLGEAGFHVLAPDLRGHGESDWSTDVAYEPDDHTRDVIGLLDAFGIDHAVLVGQSLGGLVAASAAGLAPERAVGLVLVDIGAQLERKGVSRIVSFLRGYESFVSLEEAAGVIAEYNSRRPPTPERIQNLRRNLREGADGRWRWKYDLRGLVATPDRDAPEDRAAGDAAIARIRASMERAAAGITCPVMVLRGAESDVLSGSGASEMSQLLPGAEIVVVDQAGHIVAGDNPRSTTDATLRFLDRLGIKPGARA